MKGRFSSRPLRASEEGQRRGASGHRLFALASDAASPSSFPATRCIPPAPNGDCRRHQWPRLSRPQRDVEFGRCDALLKPPPHRPNIIYVRTLGNHSGTTKHPPQGFGARPDGDNPDRHALLNRFSNGKLVLDLDFILVVLPP